MTRIVDSLWFPPPPAPEDIVHTVLLIPLFGTVAMFAALAVVGWARERRRERTEFYRHEVLRVLAEQGKADVAALRELDLASARAAALRRREGLKIAGVVLAALGGGLLLAFRDMELSEGRTAGYVPLVLGAAVLLYVFVLAPGARKEEPR